MQDKAGGGISAENQKIADRAKGFRELIRSLPFEFVADRHSNSVTSLHPLNVSAKKVIEIMKNDYHIWLCPNGGEYADTVFRVGHIGYITEGCQKELLSAFYDMNQRGLLS